MSEVNEQADTVVILSSELIAKITEDYFNKVMFKQKVRIVDLKATQNGYAFSVSFVVAAVAAKVVVQQEQVQEKVLPTQGDDDLDEPIRYDIHDDDFPFKKLIERQLREVG